MGEGGFGVGVGIGLGVGDGGMGGRGGFRVSALASASRGLVGCRGRLEAGGHGVGALVLPLPGWRSWCWRRWALRPRRPPRTPARPGPLVVKRPQVLGVV